MAWRGQDYSIARSGVTVTRLLCDPLPLQNVLMYSTRKTLGEIPCYVQFKMRVLRFFARAVLWGNWVGLLAEGPCRQSAIDHERCDPSTISSRRWPRRLTLVNSARANKQLTDGAPLAPNY
jgi:hypothetical protein